MNDCLLTAPCEQFSKDIALDCELLRRFFDVRENSTPRSIRVSKRETTPGRSSDDPFAKIQNSEFAKVKTKVIEL